MAEKINVPAIRFAGFVDPWEQRKLGEVAPLQRGFDLPVNQMTPGPYPVVMSNGIGGWHSKYMVKGPGVVTGRSGTIGSLHYIEQNFWPHNTSLWVTSFNGNEPRFIYWLYASIGLERFGSGSGVPTLNRNDVHDLRVGFPCDVVEQRRIGTFFSRLDHLITLHQRKFEKLVQLKKSMLDKMFPKPGERFPEIRFAGFTDPWEQRKFGELYRPVSEKNDMSFGRDKIISVANMYFNSVVYVTEDSYLATYNVMRLGDIAFEGNRSKRFAHGRFVENTIGDGIVSHVFKVFRPVGNNFDLAYWKHAINNEKLMKDVLTRSTKASTMMHELVSSDFLEESTLVPSLDEQRAIGTAIDSMDSLITLHQRERRKAPFSWSFAWEQRKLGELGRIETGNTPPTDNEAYYQVDGMPWATPTDIDGTPWLRTEKALSELGIAVARTVPAGSILCTCIASIGKNAITQTTCGFNQQINALAPKKDYYDSYFLFTESVIWSDQMKKSAAAATMQIVNKTEFSNLETSVPSLEEQRQIGSFFAELDNLITLHQ